MTNCPNCGAVIDNYRYVKCPYCGTDYYDIANVEIEKPFYIKVKNKGRTLIAKVLMRNMSINSCIGHGLYYDDDYKQSYISGMHDVTTDIEIKLDVINSVIEEKPSMIIVDNKEGDNNVQ